MIPILTDWSLLSEEEKLEFIMNHNPEQMVAFIDSMKNQKIKLAERMDMALAEIKLLKEQIRKMPFLFEQK